MAIAPIAPWVARLSRLRRLADNLVSRTAYFPVGVQCVECLSMRPDFALLRQEFCRFVTELPIKHFGRPPFRDIGFIYGTIRELDEEHFSATLPLTRRWSARGGPLRG